MNKYNRSFMRVAFEIFLLSVLVIVTMHSFAYDYGFHLNYSISRYVGLEWWSAVVFAICNFVVCEMIFRYLRDIHAHWKMNTMWWISALTMLLGLIVLSFCPIGLFDETWGEFGLVSVCHRVSSQVMFAFAILTAFETVIKFRNSRLVKFFGTAFVLYGTAAAVMFLTKNAWFEQYVLIFESLFIFGYLVFLLCIPEFKTENKKLDD